MVTTDRDAAPRFTPLARIARIVVPLVLIAAAWLTTWFGAFIIAFDFTGGYDSPYALIGSPFMLVGMGATIAAWLLLRDMLERWRSARAVFTALVFVAPLVAGIATRVYEG